MVANDPDRRSVSGTASNRDVMAVAQDRLASSGYFGTHFKEIACDFTNGVLTIRGRVPTFYLKQILQEVLRDVDGVSRIDNQVNVVSATGLSSIPREENSS